MNGWIWSAGHDGSSWYRCDLPSQALAWEGHRFPVCEILPESQLRRAPVVIGSRIAQPKALSTWRALRERGARLVLDLDDDYFAIDSSNPAARFWTPPLLAGLKSAIQLSHVVTCASEELARRIESRFDVDTRHVPNGLPAQYLSQPRSYEAGPVTFGWAGSASTAADIVPGARRALERIAQYQGGRHRVLAVGALPEATGLPGRHVEWVAGNERYLATVSAFDVWVAPYRDTAFNQAKFPTKALEAGFLGIPLVASNTMPFRAWTEDRRPSETGVILVGSDHEWGRALRMLAEEPEVRASMGRAARSWAAQRGTLQGLGQVWADVVA